MTGQTISHYVLLEKLGEGGMGVVYKAEDTKLERPVALKFLPAHLLGNEDVRKRFEREAKSAAALSHPNVCRVYEIDEADGKAFLAMELIEGESLEKKIAQGPLNLDEALSIGQQVAKGLEAAHRRGIVHRDIKPENIMVGEDGHVTIMDFGLALLTEASRLTKTDETLGTVAYMSPEQTEGSGTDHRSDIWSLGVVLYEMVTGQQPFKGHYDKAVMYSILNEEPEPVTGLRTGVPMEVEWIVGKCLAKLPGDRYQSATETLVDLSAQSRRIEQGRSPAIKRDVAADALMPQPAGKRKWLAVVGAVVAILALLGAAFWAGANVGTEGAAVPTYKRLTFRRGTVTSARFAPDGDTIVYSAAWEGGRREMFTTRLGSSESRSLNFQDMDILAISKTSEMVLASRPPRYLAASFQSPNLSFSATLWQASLAGGAPRELLRDVVLADFAPDGQLGVSRLIEGRTRVELPIGKVLYDTADKIASFRISPRDGRIAFSERPFGFAGEWQVATLTRDGGKTVVGVRESGDGLNVVWSPDGDTVWYDEGWHAGNTIGALALSGAENIVRRGPAALRLLDVSGDGRALVSRVHLRVAANCLAPGQRAERDLSWFDASEVADMSSDGETILMTEFGEGGGLGRWGVYLRSTGGDPAVRLGDGMAFALSPDGKMALAMSLGSPPEIVLLPTGAGESIRIRNDGMTNYEAMDWMPGSRQFVFVGSASGQGVRCYLQGIDGGEPRPLTPAGYRFGVGRKSVSPGGEWIAAKADGPLSLFATDGGEKRTIPDVKPTDNLVAWSADGHSIFLSERREIPLSIYRVDITTGKRSLWKTLGPADLVGVFDLWSVQLSADEQSYCYSYGRNISDLFLVEGLR